MKTRIHLFNSLNNAEKANLSFLFVDYSIFNLRFLQLLQDAGFIKSWHLASQESRETLVSKKTVENLKQLKLKIYLKNSKTFSNLYPKPFFKITPISKSSRPFYSSYLNLWKVDRGLSIYILSTSKGLLTDRQARQLKIGGEIICKLQSF